jgi:hypothetical protein
LVGLQRLERRLKLLGVARHLLRGTAKLGPHGSGPWAEGPRSPARHRGLARKVAGQISAAVRLGREQH